MKGQGKNNDSSFLMKNLAVSPVGIWGVLITNSKNKV